MGRNVASALPPPNSAVRLDALEHRAQHFGDEHALELLGHGLGLGARLDAGNVGRRAFFCASTSTGGGEGRCPPLHHLDFGLQRAGSLQRLQDDDQVARG
jgi:hypothetical protein